MAWRKEYERWMAQPSLDKRLKEELEAADDLQDRFCQELTFGTGGLRGIMGAGRIAYCASLASVRKVRMLSKLSRWPMLNPMTTEQRIAELQTSVRYSRTSVSRERVMSDWRIAMAEQKQPKRLVDSNESLRRKNKYGMIRDEQDATVE